MTERCQVKVELYTTGWCPYCIRAKHLLDKKGVRYQEYRIDRHPELRAEMVQRSGGGTTVPQIFVDGRPIGGSDDLHALEYQGRLDALLGLDRQGE